MTDLTAAELAKLLQQHGNPGRTFGSKGMVDRCRQCPFEKYPCLALRLAEEVQRRRDAEAHQDRLLP